MQRLPFAFLSCLTAVACLREEAPVEDAQSLVRGRNIERLVALELPDVVDGAEGARTWIQYEQRTRAQMGTRGGASDVWLVSWDGRDRRLLARNRSDKWWIDREPTGGEFCAPPCARYVMVDEREVMAVAPVQVATLVRLTNDGTELERVPGVASFGIDPFRGEGYRFFYRRPAEGAMYPDLYLRDGQTERALGMNSGAAQFAPRGGFYFFSGPDRTLTRLSPDSTDVQPLRKNVSRFLVNSDERYAIVTTAEGSRPTTVVLDLQTLAEFPLSVPNPCCWLNLSSTEFVFTYAGTMGTPSRVHYLNLATRAERVINLPLGMSEVQSIVHRPGGGETLYLDGQGQAARVLADGTATRVEGRLYSPTYIADGRLVLYVRPEVSDTLSNEGQLVIQDAEFAGPRRQLSPVGGLVLPGGFFFMAGNGGTPILVFWSRQGRRNSSDLFFANHETGDRKLVAEGINQVTVSPERVVGILRISQQDLVGDLVQKQTSDGAERVIARSVSEWANVGGRLAFVVRGRAASEWDGVWAAVLQ